MSVLDRDILKAGSRRVDSVLRHARDILTAQGIDGAELDARLLVCHVLDISFEQLIRSPERRINQSYMAGINEVLARRVAHEPVSRIIGTRDFWRSTFVLNSDTLDPRPDSEVLIEAALECAALLKKTRGDDLRILDLGTGSGCLLISMLMELEHAFGVGVDVAPEALFAARHNAELAGVEDQCSFVCSDWMASLGAGFDLILCNPPYIPTADIEGLEAEVRSYDPKRALDGGVDGFDAYARLIADMHDVLNPGAWVLFEVGEGQAERVSDLFVDNNFNLNGGLSAQLHDLSGLVRCVRATGNGVLTVC